MQTRDETVEAWEALDRAVFELVTFAREAQSPGRSPKTIKSMVCALMIYGQLTKAVGDAATRYAVSNGSSSKRH